MLQFIQRAKLKGGLAVSKQNPNTVITEEIVDYASVLPRECQDCILAIAKGMVFAKNSVTKIAEEKAHEETV